jgi:type III secretory pathway lipoprotein EscJ
MRAALLLLSLFACAPTIDGPVERQRTRDRHDADRLAAQLAQLPGAIRAEVTLHRPIVDPLTRLATPPSAAVLVVIDDGADRQAITRGALALVRGTAPEIAEPAIVVELGAVRPALSRVGPFTVAASSRGPLIGALAGGLGLVALLAGYLAWRERWRLARR